MRRLIPILLISAFWSATNIQGQIRSFGLGGFIGLGTIQSNSPSLTSFCGSFFLDVKPSFLEDFYLRISFLYARKIDYFLPENRLNRYYPFIRAFSLKIFSEQKLNEKIFVEEGIGPLALNDRTFSDYYVWCYGISLNALIGVDFRNENLYGFKFGLGIEYGNTFTKTSANYYFVNLQAQYIF